MYKKCLTKNQPKVGINMKSNKEEILRLYFKEKLKQVEISEIIGISKNAVSKVVKQDNRYKSEKNNRKQLSKKSHNKKIQTIVENKRKILKEKNDADFYILKMMHEQASKELSGGKKTISNIDYRNWNKSAYEYNKNKDTYILKKELTVGADISKRIKWKM